MDKIIKTKHESFGMLQISRVSSSKAENFFGSSVKHHHFIRLAICRGVKLRNLSRDWYMDDGLIVEVKMSANQFAEAITSLNMGCGTPVTLHYVQGEGMKAQCPEEHRRELFQNEFQDVCKDVAGNIEKLSKRADEILSGRGVMKATEREELRKSIENLHLQIRNSMPFVASQFNEQMDKTVQEGKGEIEAFFTGAIHKAGLEALQERLKPELIGYDKNDFADSLQTEEVKIADKL